MDYVGQISAEYLMIIAITFLITLMVCNYIADAQELNMALGAARTGALNGIIVDGFAIYPKNLFEEYENQKSQITAPSSIKIIKVETLNQGFNNNYKRTKIQLKLYVFCPSIKNDDEKNSLGDRINFNVRKSICKCFRTENLTNGLFNPAFSSKYMFTTADVRWIDN